MSFQGDVAGIGLGELLQGLARGGKDGVLTLYGKGIASTIGVKKGLLYLLESPEEDDEQWRLRAECAWADFADPHLDHARREAIARAERLEVVFQMLEAQSLHFRFEPGPLPLPKSARLRRAARMAVDGSDDDAAFGQGMPVEYVLLEHARISDESSSGGARPERVDVPRPMDAGSKPQELRSFLSQCDGMSSVGEIADRLGWPLRQCRGAINELVNQGALRLAPPRELLALAQRELDEGRNLRAASRLSGWLLRSQPGPPAPGDAELLVGEWHAGRLAKVFPYLAPREGRALVRRIDFAEPVRESSIERWNALAEAHKQANATRLRAAGQSSVWVEEPEPGAVLELLRLARVFQDAGQKRRAATALRIALLRPPANVATRIEIGSRLIDVGLTDEGGALLYEVAYCLLEEGERERAIGVLHTLLKGVPGHREGQGLLLQSRAQARRAERRRWQTMVGAALLLVVAAVGLVQVRANQRYERNLAEVTDLLPRPLMGLQKLDELFPGDDGPRVLALRGALMQRLRDDESTARERWLERHAQVMSEVEEGDPVTALKRTLELPAPPALVTSPSAIWPHPSELYNQLAKRLEAEAKRCNPADDAPSEEFHAEERLIALVGELVEIIEAQPLDGARDAFAFRLRTLHTGLRGRREQRALALQQKLARELEERQDWMLAAARAHTEALRLDLAVRAYTDLAQLEGSAELMPLIEHEVEAAKTKLAAYERAVELATAGRHVDARKELAQASLDERRLLLPWRVDTVPSGATVRLGDGTVRKSPFVVQSSAGRPLELTFDLEGCEPRTLVVERPEDLRLAMHRLPERAWTTGNVVRAAPVPVGEDHVVADRAGNLARLRPDGTTAWSLQLDTLGGVARTPQFLPARPGVLLVLSEDGQAWFVQAADGHVIGEWKHAAPPKEGPVAVRGGLGVIFADGTVAIWESAVEPRLQPAGGMLLQDGGRSGPATADRDPKLAILRQGSGGTPDLQSPWSAWRAEVRDDAIVVRRTGTDQSFSVRRDGDWSFLAWEAPNALIAEGRLWVADGGGLRSFLPPSALRR